MPLSADALVHAVNDRIAAVVSAKRDEFLPLGDDLAPVFNQISSFTEGGKRARARFVAAGAAQAVGQTVPADLYTAIVDAAAGLELFHAAALVHDDVLDRSDTRRGKPATHRVFEQLHRESSFAGEAEHFGTSAAILIGDLLLMWSDDLLLSACAHIDERSARRVRHEYARMRTEVTAGQFLDISAAYGVADDDDTLAVASKVLEYKSASYSMRRPALIGARLGGASDAQYDALASFGSHIGHAFQLRDDVLGVWGDEALTGKPTGGDLREGKATVLVLTAMRRADEQQAATLTSVLGAKDCSDDDIERAASVIEATGARAHVESLIDEHLEQGLAALAATNFQEVGREGLTQLARLSTRRAY